MESAALMQARQSLTSASANLHRCQPQRCQPHQCQPQRCQPHAMPSSSGAKLSGANLSGANLSGADLSGADLSDADLRRANLSGANLGAASVSCGVQSSLTSIYPKQRVSAQSSTRARARLARTRWSSLKRRDPRNFSPRLWCTRYIDRLQSASDRFDRTDPVLLLLHQLQHQDP